MRNERSPRLGRDDRACGSKATGGCFGAGSETPVFGLGEPYL
jgi:hypothetical protein